VTGDLDDLLVRAADDRESALSAVPADTLAHVRTAVRRRRRLRHTVESIGTVAVVGAVVAAVTLGGSRAPLPAVTPTPSPTSTVTPAPTPTPSATPAGAPTREAQIDDATALTRLAAPRTGETWTAPRQVPAPPPLTDDGSLDWYLVGQRGSADIYVATPGVGSSDEGEIRFFGLPADLYELEAGTLRHILCPSARSGDACAQASTENLATQDADTFYDTLTPPRSIPTAGGYTLSTAATWETPGAITGDMAAFVLDDEPRVLQDLGGGLQLVERALFTAADAPAGLANVGYALRLPYGAVVDLSSADVPGGDSATITWDDGASYHDGESSTRTAAPAGTNCGSAMFSVLTDGIDPAAWVQTGRTADGRRVHTPAPGHLELATEVFTWHQQNSWTLGPDMEQVEGADAYPYDSVEQLLADRALFALEGPGGRWLVGLRGDAVNTVYECV